MPDTEVVEAKAKDNSGDEGWKKILNHVLDNIHNRLAYGTQANKKAIEEAAGEEEPKRDYIEGFKKLKKKGEEQ
jgi:hypothetical protein